MRHYSIEVFMAVIRYKDYIASIEFDPDIDSFFGRVVNIRDVVTFYGRSVEELQKEFAASIQAYLDLCAQKGIEPSKPFSGRFNIRMRPDLHRRAALAAAREGKSLNAWAVEIIEKAAEHTTST
jgi:predicted HicB family RNase H-like nuclease